MNQGGSQNPNEVNPKVAEEKSYTPPAQPTPAQKAPEGVNAGQPASASATKSEEKALAQTGNYVPGGLNAEIVNTTTKNPAQSDQNFPFATGHKMHEVAQYQNFFTYPLDTYYNVFDAIYYFSDEQNRNRYTYEQQQVIMSRIVRAAQDFGIPIDGIREKLAN